LATIKLETIKLATIKLATIKLAICSKSHFKIILAFHEGKRDGRKFNQEPILRVLNLQLQRQRCCGLERFYIGKIIFILKTRYAISRFVHFHNAGVVARDRRIGS
jgi:hypothetical protein